MNVKMNNKEVANLIEMADIFKVEKVNGSKQIRRWGFFANQYDGTYAIYKPEIAVCNIGDSVVDEEPGMIQVVEKEEIYGFIDSLGNIAGLPFMAVNDNTACGWYYDTIVHL